MQGATWCNHLLGASARHRYLACSTPLRKISKTPASAFSRKYSMLTIFRYFVAKLPANLDSVSPQLCDCPPQTSLLGLRNKLTWETHESLRNCDPNCAQPGSFSLLNHGIPRVIFIAIKTWDIQLRCEGARGMKKQSGRSMMKDRNNFVLTLTKYMSLSQKWFSH